MPDFRGGIIIGRPSNRISDFTALVRPAAALNRLSTSGISHGIKALPFRPAFRVDPSRGRVSAGKNFPPRPAATEATAGLAAEKSGDFAGAVSLYTKALIARTLSPDVR